jgi:16S rRNA (uracil1498-N3)-methyltransferase
VFSEDLGEPALLAEDAHHLDRVLRLRPGEEVIVSDGQGHWRRCRWTAARTLEPLGQNGSDDEAAGPGADGGVQFEAAATPELGIDCIVPLLSERSVVRWTGARGTGAVERLRRVAREAAAQCRRVWLPEVTELVEFSQLAGLAGPGNVVLAQLSGDRLRTSHTVVAVGPEGGWSSDELGSGLPTVGFGLSVLRAETAAVTAGALMVSLRTGTVAAVGAAPA